MNEQMMRLKGCIVSSLVEKNDGTATFLVEVRLPTKDIIDHANIPGPPLGNDKRSGKAGYFFIPNEFVVYFFDDANDKEILSRLTRGQLKGIILKAIEDGKLPEEIIFSYEGGFFRFTEDEIEIIRSYIKPDTFLLEPMKKLKSGRMLRPK